MTRSEDRLEAGTREGLRLVFEGISLIGKAAAPAGNAGSELSCVTSPTFLWPNF